MQVVERVCVRNAAVYVGIFAEKIEKSRHLVFEEQVLSMGATLSSFFTKHHSISDTIIWKILNKHSNTGGIHLQRHDKGVAYEHKPTIWGLT